MPVTRKSGLPPLVLPSEAGEIAASRAAVTVKASAKPGPHHVRVHRGEAARGAGVERVISSASPMALAVKP